MFPQKWFMRVIIFGFLVTIPLVYSSVTPAGASRDLKVFAKLGFHSLEPNIGPLGYDFDTEQFRRQIVIRSAEELVMNTSKNKLDPKKTRDLAFQKQAEAELAKLLKVKAIDWDKQMVVAIWDARVRTPWSVELVSFVVKGGKLTVTWRLKEEKGDYSWPRGVALVERLDGIVLFSSR